MPVYELEFDDDNLAEIEAHGISMEDVIAVFESDARYFRNKKRGAGTLLMIGPDAGGRLLAVPIIETPVYGRWRPITAWPANRGQQTRWRKAK